MKIIDYDPLGRSGMSRREQTRLVLLGVLLLIMVGAGIAFAGGVDPLMSTPTGDGPPPPDDPTPRFAGFDQDTMPDAGEEETPWPERPEGADVLDDAALRDAMRAVEHWQGLGANQREWAAYYSWLDRLDGMTVPQVRERIEADALRNGGMPLTPVQYGKKPARWAGSFIETRGGLVARPWEVPAPPNEAGVERVWEGVIANQRNEPHMFHVLERPVEVMEDGTVRPLGRGDDVVVRGVFFKIIRVPSRSGGWRSEPLVLSPALQHLPPVKDRTDWWVPGILVALMFVLGLVFLVSSVRQRKAEEELRRTLLEKRRERMSAQSGRKAGDSDSASSDAGDGGDAGGDSGDDGNDRPD